jgi:hypothetical protein
MPDRVPVPIKLIKGERWGDLNSLSLTHEICGERVDKINDNLSFAGGHRVRLYRFRKNVHWRIPESVVTLDISAIAPAALPRKK